MERNHTMIQFFEWHLPADQNHWNRLKEVAPELKEAGIDAVWIPPVTKASSPDDNGYSVYDVYDLGEFEQKGSTATKYGTKEQLHEAIQACHDHGISVYVDIVMNHKAGADETETFQVIEVDADNRTNEISEPFDIEGWTKFTAAKRATVEGINVVLANGKDPAILRDLINGKELGTLFLSQKQKVR